MSEVLITIVIIGIIAAITVPAISRSSQKYILKNQFKKAYSTITNAMYKADMDLGGNTICYYPTDGTNADETRSDCDTFFPQMIANLSIQKACKGNAKADGCIPDPWLKNYPYAACFSQNYVETLNNVYILADGTILVLYKGGKGLYPLMIVDINGSKGPNEFGKDAFIFYITSDGKIGLKISDNLLRWVYGQDIQRAYFQNLSDIYGE